MHTTLHRLCLLLLVFPPVWIHPAPPAPRRDPVIHPQIESLGLRPDGRIYAWVYFTDRGSGTSYNPEDLNITPRARVRREKVLPGRVLSDRDLPVHEPYVSEVTETGAVIRHRSRWFNAVSISAPGSQLAEIARLPFVTRIDPVLIHHRPIEDIDPVRGQDLLRDTIQSADTLDYGDSRDQIRQINVHLAHEAGYAGQDVLVLMLDTGFFTDHESIDADRIVAEWDVINDDSTTQDEPQDTVSQHAHGTYTFSALGGYAPGKLIGPAYRASFLLAKTEIVTEEIQLEEDNYVAALEWGERLGADVASSSLGYLDWYTYEDMDGNTAVTTTAVDIAVSLGVVCVTAVGNEGNRPWFHMLAPADADSVISVGAVDGNGALAPFSSRGPTYDGRIKPEVCARGLATVCAGPQTVSTYTRVGGTSLATPLVAGAAAVILSAHPDWTPMMVRDALMKTASRAGSPGNDYGWGIIDTWEALRFGEFIPEEFGLIQNYPNPFNEFTTIQYDVPVPARVTVTVFNLLGQPVATLVSGMRETGRHTVYWDGAGSASGVYVIHMRASGFSDSKKMILIK